MEVDHHHGDGANLEQGYLSSRNVNSCGFPDPSTSSAPGHFLGKPIEGSLEHFNGGLTYIYIDGMKQLWNFC